ncbi:MAG: hypothetical protein K1X74_03450 [Pirellulales bacterium]|nr:hypothetical protein [Pirellulales bacterium]
MHYRFEGVVDEVHSIVTGIAVGDPFSGEFSYDAAGSTILYDGPLETVYGISQSIDFDVLGIVVNGDPDFFPHAMSGQYEMHVYNDVGDLGRGFSGDALFIYFFPPTIPDIEILAGIFFADTTGSVFSDRALPPTIDFADFDRSGFGFGAYSLTYGIGETLLFGSELRLVPEPSSEVLFMLGALLLLGAYKLTRRNGDEETRRRNGDRSNSCQSGRSSLRLQPCQEPRVPHRVGSFIMC